MALHKYIDIEASRNSNILTDVDNFRRKYFDKDSSLGLTVLFPGFELTTVSQHLYLLYSDSRKVPWKPRWEMRPDYASFDQYNTVVYWWLLLYVNRIDSLEDFRDLDEIIVPSFDSIKEMVADRILPTEFETFESTNYDDKTRYYKRYPLDLIEANTLRARESLVETQEISTTDCIIKEITDTFTLDSDMISNGYVDLTYNPINYSSIIFHIRGYSTVQSYSYDYVLKYISNTTLLRRISWLSDDTPLGLGMTNLLEIGDIINITYAYSEIECDICQEESDFIDGGIFS